MTDSAPPTRSARIAAALAPAVLPLLLLARPLLRGDLLYGYDTVGELYPWWTWAWQRIAHGDFPHWNPNVLCGLPFHGLAVVSLAYPPSLLNLVLDPPRVISLWCLAHLVLAGLFTQRLARALGCSPWAAALAGCVFAGGEALLSRVTAGELPQLAVVAWVPAVLWVVEDALGRRAPARLWFAAPLVAWMLLAGHLQYVIYGSMLAASYLGARLLGEPQLRRRPSAWLAFAGVWPVGAALAAHQVLPTLDALRESHRHLGLAPADGGGILLAPAGLLRLLAPDLLGSEYLGTYVGPSVATQTPLYAGLVPLFLAATAVARRVPRSRLLAALAFAAVVFAFGDRAPLAPLVRALLPPLAGFRIPSRMLVVGALPFALLAGLGLDAIRDRRIRRRTPAGWLGGATVIGALVGLGAITLDLPAAREAWLHLTELAPSSEAGARLDTAWATARGSAARSAAWLATAWLSVALARGGERGRWARGLVLAVALLDLAAHSSPWIRSMPADRASMAPDLDSLVAAMRADASVPPGARVLSDVPIAREPRPPAFVNGYGIGAVRGEVVPNWLAAHGVRSVTGEIGIIPARTMLFTGNAGRYAIDGVTPPSRLDALAVAWIVEPTGSAGPLTSPLAATRRDGALPLSFLVDRIRPTTSAADAARRLDEASGGMIDPRHELLVEGVIPAASSSPGPLAAGDPGRATTLLLANDRVAVSVAARRPAWLVVLEPFARRWEASVDGVAAPIHPAQVMFRAIAVPRGHHLVEMRYVPTPFRVGVALAGVTSLAALLGVAVVQRRAPRALPIASGRR